MKKYLLLVVGFFLSLGMVYPQNTAGTVVELDNTVKALAADLNKKLIEEKVQKIVLGQFSYQDSLPQLGVYLANQLSAELTRIPNRSFTLLSGGAYGADWTISGEIVEAADTIRVYTRLVRSDNRALAVVFISDFKRTELIAGMLYSDDSRSGNSSSYVPRDTYETDSWDNPVPFEIGADENTPVMNRTIHRNDEDFFLLVPANDGRLVMETTGDVDTYLEFYNAETREKLGSDDDSGSGDNARVRYNVSAGSRYIAKVRGYGSSDTGRYGFRAYLQPLISIAPDEFENDDTFSQARWIYIGTVQQHNFHNGDDVDWVKFQVTRNGRYTIRAKGLNSDNLDTNIELFDSNQKSIAEDDDGGENVSSRLSRRLDSGLYYLKVTCLDSDPDEPYIISIEAE